MKKISVIIPVYNSEKYLDKCIESVISQTDNDFELLLIDDGSSDGSALICDNWKDKDERVVVHHQKNLGVSCARNKGIELATGEYIMFLDSDDYWTDKSVLSSIKRRLSVCYSDVLSVNFEKEDKTKKIKSYFSKESFDENKYGYPFRCISSNNLWISSPCNKVINSRLFDNGNLRFREGIYSEDVDWCLRLAIIAQTFDYIDVSLFVYLQHSDSLSHSKMIEKKSAQLDNILYCFEVLKDCNDIDKKDALNGYMSYQYSVFLYSLSSYPKSKTRDELIKASREYVYLLKYSNNGKVRMMYIVHQIFGFKVMFNLLKLIS